MRYLYLAGPINGCTDEEAKGWRDRVKRSLAGEYYFLDPMERDYRGKEAEHAAELVEDDLDDIERANVILVNRWKASDGTAMECWHAGYKLAKPIVLVCAGPVSPWWRFVARKVFPTMDEAVAYLRTPHARHAA